LATPKTTTIIAASIVGSFSLPTIASAQDWQFSPDITLKTTYNDNSRLHIDDADQDELRGGELDVRALLSRRSPSGSVVFIPRVTTSYYSDNPEDESDDYFLLFDGQHRAQRSAWSFRTRYSSEQVRKAELQDPDFDDPDVNEPITDDSGLIQLTDRRSRFWVSPSVRFQTSPRNSIEFVGAYVALAYDLNVGGLKDYTNGKIRNEASFQVI